MGTQMAMRVLAAVFVACCAVAIAGEWDSVAFGPDMDVVPLQGAWGHEGQHPGEAKEALGDQVLLQDYSRQCAGRRARGSKGKRQVRRAPQRRRKVTKVVQDKAKGQVNKAATKARVIVKKAPPGAKPGVFVKKAPPGAKPGVIEKKAPLGAKTSVIVRKAPPGAKPGVFVRKVKSSTANSGTAKSSPLSMTVEKAPSGAKPGVYIAP